MIYTGLNNTEEVEAIYAAKRVTTTGTPPLSYPSKGYDLEDFLISGNTVQDSTPTPEAPVDVVGCGVRTENLFDYTDLEGGYIDPYTGLNMPNDNQKRTRNYITVQANTAYTLSNYDDKCRIHQYSNNSYLGSTLSDEFQYTFTTNSNCTRIRISGSKDNFLETTMLNLGSTALPYGYKIPIAVNGTVYPIYIGQVETTRKIKKYEFTGQEPFFTATSTLYNNTLYFGI